MTQDDYALGRSDEETQRLVRQNQIYGWITRRMFEAAGIGAGMRVLDLGSGAGDVALLLADLVGPRGRVVGVDMNAQILDLARSRVAAAGWSNVTFNAGDVREAKLDADFDAVVGRWVLIYIPERVELLRDLAGLLRPGGIVAFCEMDLSYPPTNFPATELSDQIQRWMVPPVGAPGPESRLGTKLYNVFVDAGLPPPELRLEAPIGGGPDWPGYQYVTDTLRSLLPMLQGALGIDPKDIAIDTLADRLRDDAIAHRAVQMLPFLICAWSRKAA